MLYCEICSLRDIYNDTSDRNEIRFVVAAYLRMYSECGIFDLIYVQWSSFFLAFLIFFYLTNIVRPI